jgi:uncharacterized protein
MDRLYKSAITFLKTTLDNTGRIDDTEKKYRYEHSLRVSSIAKHIAEKEGQDVLIATVSAILHDAGKYETDINEDHGRVSADFALPFLKSADLTDKQVRDIHFAIAKHADGNAGYEYEDIPEAETVSDSDNIDRFGVYRIYQHMLYDKYDTLSIEDTIEKCEKKIARNKYLIESYKLYTDTANKLWHKNLAIQIDFFENLINELKLTAFPAEIDI